MVQQLFDVAVIDQGTEVNSIYPTNKVAAIIGKLPLHRKQDVKESCILVQRCQYQIDFHPSDQGVRENFFERRIRCYLERYAAVQMS